MEILVLIDLKIIPAFLCLANNAYELFARYKKIRKTINAGVTNCADAGGLSTTPLYFRMNPIRGDNAIIIGINAIKHQIIINHKNFNPGFQPGFVFEIAHHER